MNVDQINIAISNVKRKITNTDSLLSFILMMAFTSAPLAIVSIIVGMFFLASLLFVITLVSFLMAPVLADRLFTLEDKLEQLLNLLHDQTLEETKGKV